MTTLPTVVTSAGLTPLLPADVLAQLIASTAAAAPGYTGRLPGSLISDVNQTDTFAILQCDQTRIDLINSLTALGANEFLLSQQGQQLGIPIAAGSNTSVLVVFTGTPGFVIDIGFTVGDGQYQYTITDGGVVGADNGSGNGTTQPLFALANLPGSWPVAAGTVQQLLTSVPGGIVLSVNNPLAGTPATTGQTSESYRVTVQQGQLAASTGMTTTLKTQLAQVSGVQPNLVSVLQAPNNGGWEIIVGGGDPYQVAYAIQRSGIDISSLIGSSITVSAITKATLAQVTTTLNHGYVATNPVTINGVLGMTQINGVATTVAAVIDEKNFTININSTGFSNYISGGVCTPNARNNVVSIDDYPNTYTVTYVTPPLQTVTVSLVWNTSSVNFVNTAAVAQLGAPAIAAYINAITVGQPINVFQMQQIFTAAIATALNAAFLTRMVFSVSINGVSTGPLSGTEIIQGDPESYFSTSAAAISIVQG